MADVPGARRFSFQDWEKELQNHPAFLNAVPHPETGELPIAVQALQAMKYDDDDDPVEERVKAYKDDGNKQFHCKKYRDAVEAYTQAIKLACPDKETNAILHSNRAAAHFRLANYRSAFKDSVYALRFKPNYPKALHRGAQCLFNLHNYAETVEWIDKYGMDKEDGLLELKKQAMKLVKHTERDLRKVAQIQRKEENCSRELVRLLKIKEYQRAITFRFGRLMAPRGPGLVVVTPLVDKVHVVDLREQTTDLQPQLLLTKECVTIEIDAVIFWRIDAKDPSLVVTKVKYPEDTVSFLAQTLLRGVVGVRTLAQVMSDRDGMTAEMKQLLDGVTTEWGMMVERVEFKSILLPERLKRSMAAEAEAEREAGAKLIAAQGELESSYALREAAKEIGLSSHAMQLKYLQTLGTVATERQSTLLFPLPINMGLQSFMPSASNAASAHI